jgi:hypothetical protein
MFLTAGELVILSEAQCVATLLALASGTVQGVSSSAGSATVAVPPRNLDGTFRLLADRGSLVVSPDRAAVTLSARNRARVVLEED